MKNPRARWAPLVTLALASLPTVAAGQREPLVARAALDLMPLGRTAESLDTRATLVPFLAGETLLVTSTLRLFAFDARTTELLWSAGPPDGWNGLAPAVRDELLAGLDRMNLWVAPAAGERVTVAALQIPQSKERAESWQGIHIRTRLPERRLFAFELATGRPLWNHAPPGSWDGASGSFAERTSVIGSPVVVGGRVLVPCTADRSSIDYHVACYRLETGELLWSSFVVRGQAERNMFEFLATEHAAPPLVADPARGQVVALTGLGTVAALDLASGRVVWRASYPAIPLPKTRSYHPPKRTTFWRTEPPIVVEDVLLAAPRDSRELLAFDLHDGRALWSVPVEALHGADPGRRELGIDRLIAADRAGFYLGGDRAAACAFPAGPRSRPQREPRWTRALPSPLDRIRGQLAGDALYLPGPEGCLVLARASGAVRATLDVQSPAAHLVTDECVLVLTEDGLRRIER